MSNIVTIDLPSEVADRARAVAAHTHRRVEDVLVEWLGQASVELPIEWLSDTEVLAISDLQLSQTQQEALSDLLSTQGERKLTLQEQQRLDRLLDDYRMGMLRKSEALKVAVERGLQRRREKPPLSSGG